MTDFDQREISSLNEQWRIEGYRPLPTERPIERPDLPAVPAASCPPDNSSEPRRNLRRCTQMRRVQAQISRLIADLAAAPGAASGQTSAQLQLAALHLQSALALPPCAASPSRSGDR